MPTRLGIAIMGIAGAFVLAILGAGMLLAPGAFRYLPYAEVALVSVTHIHIDYNTDYYGLWAWMHLVMAVMWGGAMLCAYVTLPAQNRRIDKALRARLSPTARGAPLEPR